MALTNLQPRFVGGAPERAALVRALRNAGIRGARWARATGSGDYHWTREFT